MKQVNVVVNPVAQQSNKTIIDLTKTIFICYYRFFEGWRHLNEGGFKMMWSVLPVNIHNKLMDGIYSIHDQEVNFWNSGLQIMANLQPTGDHDESK